MSTPRRKAAGFAAVAAAGAAIAGPAPAMAGGPHSDRAPASGPALVRVAAPADARTSGPVPALGIEEAIAHALAHRPAAGGAVAAVERAEAEAAGARAPFFPEVSIGATVTKGLSGSYGALGISGLPASPFKSLFGAALNAVWTVWDFGRTLHGDGAASRWARAERALEEARREEIAFEAGDALVRCATADARTAAAAELSGTRETAVLLAEALARAGLRSEVDAGLARAGRSEAARSLMAARAVADICRLDLAAALALPAPPPALRALPPPAPGPLDVEATVRESLARNPEIRALRHAEDALREERRAASAGHLPEVRVMASVGWARISAAADEAFLDDPAYYAVGAGVKVPLFDGLATSSAVRAARASERIATAARAEAEARLAAAVRGTIVTLRAATERAAAARGEVAATDDLVRLAEANYRAGLGSITELAEAGLAASRARADLADAEADAVRAALLLRAFAGRLAPSSPR